METIIKAKFLNGVIKPLKQLDIEEGAEVYEGVFYPRDPRKSEQFLFPLAFPGGSCPERTPK